MIKIYRGFIILFTLFVWVAYSDYSSGQNREVSLVDTERDNTMSAQFVEDGVTLDGFLNEESWQAASAISDFKQHEPVDGSPATQRTEVRVLYGLNSLYVGAMLYDDEPAAIEKTLGRRDDFNRADWFLVAIDSYYDRRTAYTFGINAAGVQFDAIQASSGGGGPRRGGGSNAPRGMDASWDAIWYSSARVTPEGWTVEMRIPYSMLRFSDDSFQTWGIHFTRRNPRLGEQSEWPHVPRTQRDNLVAQFGKLKGIQDVSPRRNIQITPYTVSRLQTEENPESLGNAMSSQSMDVGGDLKIGLGPNVTLDMTINPDFGQVEADPAVLNLTAFETFFQERRPFFVEGIQIYQFDAGFGELLYTRRIGAEAPIIGASKLSGRTASGLSFGVLGAATGDKFNPTRGYGVARMSQQIGAFSSAGGIVTLFDDTSGDQHLRSFAAGADWDLRLQNNQYGIEGFFSVTNRNWINSDTDKEFGFAGRMRARKRQGTWNGSFGIDMFSDKFNPNDIGQLRRNNSISLNSRLEHEINGGQPFGPFLRGGIRGSFWQQFSYLEGLGLGQEFDIGSRLTLKGFQSLGFGIEYENPFGGYDLFETRGLLPWAQPSSFDFRGSFETDERRSWQVEPGLSFTAFDDGGLEYGLSLEGQWNAGSRLSLSGEIEGEWGNNVVAWSSNESFMHSGDKWFIGKESAHPDELTDADFVVINNASTLDDITVNLDPVSANRYYLSVFGQRDTRSVDITLRSTITFTSKISLQVYSQLFAARGRYDNFQLQQDRDTMTDFDAFPKRDEFSLSSLQSNILIRWEYRPGSSLFVVWTHGRRLRDTLNPLAPWSASPYNRSINDQFGNTFDIFPENVFLIKLNYTFLY